MTVAVLLELTVRHQRELDECNILAANTPPSRTVRATCWCRRAVHAHVFRLSGAGGRPDRRR